MDMKGGNNDKLSWGVQLPRFRRPDGRTSDLQLRPPVCEFGVLKNANGSARFKMGLTSALAAVFGPKESMNVKKFDKGSVQVIVRPLFGTKTLTERYSEAALTSVFSSLIELGQLIRTTVTIVLQSETDDGGLLSCFINAAMCALLDAGIPCKSTYLSVPIIKKIPSVSVQSAPSYILDPTIEELESSTLELDPSTYLSFTLEIYSGALVQATPELASASQQGIPILAYSPGTEESRLSWAKHWSLTVEILDASFLCCRFLAEVVRQSLRLRLQNMVTKTITANNLMQKPERS